MQQMRFLAILRLTQSQSTSSCNVNLGTTLLSWPVVLLQIKTYSSHGPHHPAYLFLKLSFGGNFGYLLKKYAFSVASLIDSHENEGFIYTITDSSEMNSEGLIENDHPGQGLTKKIGF